MSEYVTVSQFEKEIGTVCKRIDELVVETKQTRKTLFGNGIPGWDEMLRTLYADYQERKAQAKESEIEKRGEFRKYMFWIITFVVTQITTIVITIRLAAK